jgi:PAS domain S-box-containing protein
MFTYRAIDYLDHEEIRKLALVASRTDNCVIITDPSGEIEWVNRGFIRLTGFSREEAVGRRPGALLQGPKTDGKTKAVMHAGLLSGLGFKVDVLNYRKDGSPFWIAMDVQPVHDESGTLIQFIGIGADITERKCQEQALRDSEDRYRSIVNTAQEGIWLIDAKARTIFVNQRMSDMLGYRLDEMIGKDLFDFMDEEAAKIAATNMERRRAGIAENHDFRLRRKDGSDLWTMMATNPVIGDDGTFHGALALVTDITARKADEAKLAAAHAENELILATITTALVGLDINERVSRWNDAAERIFGLTLDQVIGKKLGECGLVLDWGELYLAMNTCLSDSKSVDVLGIAYQRPDGRDGTLDMSVVSSWSMHGDGAEGLGMILMATDTTARKHEEIQRQQGQKMESIGQLAAGVAHEINTPIQFIGDNLRFLGDTFGDLNAVLAAHGRLLDSVRQGPPAAGLIAGIDEAAKRADVAYLAEEIPKAITQSLEGITRVTEIVRAMKEFSHPDQGEKKSVDINKTITTTLIVARNEYKYVADLVTEFADDLPAIPCIVGEFNQVVLNLVVNAAHAIGDVVAKSGAPSGGKGTITITTRRTDDHAEIRIRDSGTGIPESARKKIFDPFFTTKGVGKGTGQGLYIAHTVVVKKHGGTLTFETEMGVGTTFIIRLPLTARSA